MLSQIHSSTPLGVHAQPILIEVHIDTGLPRYTVVGLPDGAVRESRDRIFAALQSCALPRPRGVITVNLAPADVRKEGAAFDLPIALGLLMASSSSSHALGRVAVTGELALDGSVRPVRGVLAMARSALGRGLDGLMVPVENAEEAAVVDGLDVYPVSRIDQAFAVLTGRAKALSFTAKPATRVELLPSASRLDFRDVKGQEGAKRALLVAAAGGHNALLVGPPGSGKTMLARRLPGILPQLTPAEALETTTIHSVAGQLPRGTGLVTTRPFRSPHHTISDVGLCGGGTHPLPGEISLAHHGVLFLDEMPEFKRAALEVLRQPLEEGAISIVRARSRVEFPARFMLLASMNPCPCGHMGDPYHVCTCSPIQVQRYTSRISGPLLDRIDLHVTVAAVDVKVLQGVPAGPTTQSIRQQVEAARSIQEDRFRSVPNVFTNAQMTPALMEKHASLDATSAELLGHAVRTLGLSARAYHRVCKVARTIADLREAEVIAGQDVAEAIQYRALDRPVWAG